LYQGTGFLLPYIIEANNLGKQFGSFVAVDSISFHVAPGECFGLLGPNGAGKTSTIRMTYGFSPISSGSLKVFGLDIATHWRAIRARIVVCQQDNSLDPDLSVEQNLEVFAQYFAIPKKIARQKAQDLLRFFSLDQRSKAKMTELSGGMMRRLMLARALINGPELLILDEPTSGLDPQSRHQVWEKLEELRSRGLSILLTTHYMDEAARLCDRLLILDRGRILVEGKPSQLIHEHAGHDVIEVDQPSAALRAFLQSRQLVLDDLGHRLTIYGMESDHLFHTISSQYCTENCSLRMATLEDVFLRLTGRELRD
jgi:lipooligosaccharide transport system ATP-binding protein